MRRWLSAFDPVVQRLDQLRLSQREWFDRVGRRQETYESGLLRIETLMSHWAGGLTALGAAPMTFLVGVIKAHWPS